MQNEDTRHFARQLTLISAPAGFGKTIMRLRLVT